MNLDPEKVLVLLVIALLVLGPDRLPRAARTLGKGLAEVRRYTSSFQAEVNQVLAEPRAMVQSALQEADLRSELGQRSPGVTYSQGLPARDAAPGGYGGTRPGSGQGVLPAAVPDDPGLN